MLSRCDFIFDLEFPLLFLLRGPGGVRLRGWDRGVIFTNFRENTQHLPVVHTETYIDAPTAGC